VINLNELEKFESKQKKHVECDALQLSDIKKMIEDGWKIYDTQPALNNDNVKLLTLVKE